MDKPNIYGYSKAVDFVDAQISYLLETDPNFSIRSACATVQGISPTLVTQVRRNRRKVTTYRAKAFAKLMKLSANEQAFWLKIVANQQLGDRGDAFVSVKEPIARKEVSTHILKDWVNVYVKDAFKLTDGKTDMNRLLQALSNVTTESRLKKSIKFLVKEGYLRQDLRGRLIEESPVSVASSSDESKLIKNFHKGALSVAKQGLSTYSKDERFSNALVLTLDAKGYAQLVDIISEFSEKLQNFAENDQSTGDRLYQLIVHLTPAGQKLSPNKETNKHA